MENATEKAVEKVVEKVDVAVEEGEAYIYGMESYIYGYPMVVMDVTREVLTAAPAPNSEGTAAPINQLAKMPHYVSPYFTNVVRISLNSLWTTGWVDLANEPIVLSVPDTEDRYYVFSIMNMWTDVFGSAGKRTTGTGPGNFLIVGPNWKGTAPTDMREAFRSSTRYAWVLGQTQANGPDDFAAVNALQAEYKLTPLSAWGKPYTPPTDVPIDSKVVLTPTPPEQVANMDAEAFFSRLALAMKDNPPYPADGPALERLKKIGVEPGKPFDMSKFDPKVAAVLNKAVTEVQIKMAEGATKMKNINGWIQPPNLGRYGTDYETRAGIAMVGLGADQQEDTIYPLAFVDGDGNRLDSAYKYVMHYDKDQFTPTNATWSVSLYQGPNYVPNVINRYDIAPWMPLKYGDDSSLDIYIQAESPGPDKEANWLPTPATGEFNIVIRNYWPKEEGAQRHLQESADPEGRMKILLAVAAAGEAVTGLALLTYPPIVVSLLFGAEITGAGVVMSRIAGIALIALGLACWRGDSADQAVCGMLTYSALAAAYLVYLGIGGAWAGPLLWPAVAAHVILTVLLARAWLNVRKTRARGVECGL